MMSLSFHEKTRKQTSLNPDSSYKTAVFLLLLTLYVFLLAGYVGLRYVWHNLDGDAVSLTVLSQNVLAEETLWPAAGAYPYGYAYPSLNAALVHLTGVPLTALQTFIQPLLVVLLVPVSYMAYRSLVGRSQASSLAALLLFLSPEFLFEATRSSHAKVTWLMALTMLSMLAKSLRSGHAPRRLAVWVALFYVAAYALITSNSFFASSYVFGFAFAFVSTYLLLSLRRTRSIATSKVHRLAYITVSSLLVVFLFIFYLYPPAQAQFDTLRSELDRLSVLFLGVEPSTGANPYTYTQATWLNFPVYLALTSFNWIVLLLSFMVWLHKGWLFWVRREHMSANEFLLWLLYGSFGFIMVLSVLADLLGLLSANLQLRIFPHFLLVGIPLASQGIVTLMSRLGRSRRAWLAKVAPALLAVTFAFFALASLLKITNEPLLSHWWTFHSDDERMAVQWVESSVRNNAIWIGRDARLGTLVDNYGGWSQSSIWIERALQPVNSRYVLLSDILRMQASRMEFALPDVRGLHRVYDTGGTEIYFSRPRTPFQR